MRLPNNIPRACDAALEKLSSVYSWREFVYSVVGLDQPLVCGPRKDAHLHRAAPIGCVAKAYTGMLLADLCRLGRVSLDSPAKAILPAFAVGSRAATEEISLRHLISHQSGMDTEGIVGLPGEEVGFFERLRRVGQLFAPGRGLSYCTVGFEVAARATEELGGCRWEEMLTEGIVRGAGEQVSCDGAPIVDGSVAFFPNRQRGQMCKSAALGQGFALPVGELAKFGLRWLSQSYEGCRDTILWPDGDLGFCVCGTAGEVNTRVQVLPEAGVALAARLDSPESEAGALHEFFGKVIGSRWKGFLKPAESSDRDLTIRAIEGRFCCEFLDMEIGGSGTGFIADAWVGSPEEETWIGRSRKHERISLEVTPSGVLTGAISVGPDPFPIVLEPLRYSDGLEYLIFNRKMLLRRRLNDAPEDRA